MTTCVLLTPAMPRWSPRKGRAAPIQWRELVWIKTSHPSLSPRAARGCSQTNCTSWWTTGPRMLWACPRARKAPNTNNNRWFIKPTVTIWSLMATWAVNTPLQASCAQASLRLWAANRLYLTLLLPLWGPGRVPCAPRRSTAIHPHLTAPNGQALPRTPRAACWPPRKPWASFHRCPPQYRPSTLALCKSLSATLADPTWRPRSAGPCRARPKDGGQFGRETWGWREVNWIRVLNCIAD